MGGFSVFDEEFKKLSPRDRIVAWTYHEELDWADLSGVSDAIKAKIEAAFGKLPDTEKKVVEHLLGLHGRPRLRREIPGLVGLTPDAAKETEAQALAKLRKALGK